MSPGFRVLLGLGAACLCALPIHNARAAEAHTPGSWSLQFNIGDNFTLGRFEGFDVAVKRHWTDRSALRAGVALERRDSTRHLSSRLTTESVSTESELTGVDLEALYLRYANPGAKASLFWGGGPTYRYAKSEATSSSSAAGASTNTNRDWGLGLTVVLGGEYLATQYLGVHAEYGVEMLYTDGEIRRNSPTRADTEDITSWNFGSSRFRFGLSLYF